jgi:hypothetical protein
VHLASRSFGSIFTGGCAMQYTLWSRGKRLGHTDLDLPHVQDRVRMGFIEPTEEGTRLLPDATGVPAAAHALAKAARRAAHQRYEALTEFADFRAACDRREALDLELRDEMGVLFPCEWIRINDIDDQSWAEDDFDDDEDLDPELEAAIDHDAELIESSLDEDDASYFDEDDLDCPSPWEPPDPRWETSRYHVMVYLLP